MLMLVAAIDAMVIGTMLADTTAAVVGKVR
jgi:hypothetical protein